jgi:hypothetical protein
MRSIVRHASQFSAKKEGKKTLNDRGWLVVCCPSPMLPDLAAGWQGSHIVQCSSADHLAGGCPDLAAAMAVAENTI